MPPRHDRHEDGQETRPAGRPAASHAIAAGVAIACLLLTGCKDQREPVKPIVDLSALVVAA